MDPQMTFPCHLCDAVFTQKDELTQHMTASAINPLVCVDCHLWLPQWKFMQHHLKMFHQVVVPYPPTLLLSLSLQLSPPPTPPFTTHDDQHVGPTDIEDLSRELRTIQKYTTNPKIDSEQSLFMGSMTKIQNATTIQKTSSERSFIKIMTIAITRLGRAFCYYSVREWPTSKIGMQIGSDFKYGYIDPIDDKYIPNSGMESVGSLETINEDFNYVVKYIECSYTNDVPLSGPCNKYACKTCPMYDSEPQFYFSLFSKNREIEGSYTCESSNVIYQLQCQYCPGQYIGKTTTALRTRMKSHRSACESENKENNTSICDHSKKHKKNFDDCYKVKVLASLPPGATEAELRKLELYYQNITRAREYPNLCKR